MRFRRLVSSFWWLETYGKTPHDFGVSRDQLDPEWELAMMLIRAGLESERTLNKP